MTPTVVDDRLARAASRGDERALAKIFHTYHQPLYRYCLSILGSRQDAEDALQETMVKVLRSLPGERREIALKPWLYRIAHNESIDLLRRRRENVSIEEDDGALAAGVADQVETRQRLRQLIADIGVLPERQRGALLMREAGGLDFDEIATALGTTPAVARQTLYEARLGLREMDAGRDMNCAEVTRAISDGDRRVLRRRDIRAHLRGCDGCHRFGDEMDRRRSDLAAISPLPALAAAGILHGLLGGGAGAAASTAVGTGTTGGSIGGLIGGTAVKSIGTATFLKGAATVVAVAAIGVGAADKSGLIHLGHHDPTPPTHSAGLTPPGGARPNGRSQPSTDGTDASSSSSATESEPSPGAGTSPTRHRRSVGAARPVSPPTPRHVAVVGVKKAPEGETAGKKTEAAAPPSPGKSGVEHRQGRGQDKQTPTSAAHGQETAVVDKPTQSPGSSTASEGESSSAAAEHPEHPVHPTHPTHPIHPAKPPKTAKPIKPPKTAKPIKPPKSKEVGTTPVAEEPAAEEHGKKDK